MVAVCIVCTATRIGHGGFGSNPCSLLKGIYRRGHPVTVFASKEIHAECLFD